MMKSHRRLVAGFASLLLGLAACSSTEGSSGAVDGVATLEDAASASGDAAAAATLEDEEPELTPEEAALEFSACMRDEGLDFPDIGVDADGRINLREGFAEVRGQDGFREAIDACRASLEGAGFGGGQAALQDNVELQDAFIAFSDCVRDEGFDVGDLTLGQGPGAGGGQGADGENAGDPPADGEARGRGARQGGFGDRNARLADQLGLDAEDPEVATALDTCAPIIDEALAAAGVGQPAGG